MPGHLLKQGKGYAGTSRVEEPLTSCPTAQRPCSVASIVSLRPQIPAQVPAHTHVDPTRDMEPALKVKPEMLRDDRIQGPKTSPPDQ